MQESLILFTAIAALAIPALAIVALVMAYKTTRRFDDLERRLHDLSREVRAARRTPDDDAEDVAAREDRSGESGRASAVTGTGGPEKRNYSFSFLEEKPRWEEAGAGGVAGEEPKAPEKKARDSGGKAKKRARRRRRGKPGHG